MLKFLQKLKLKWNNLSKKRKVFCVLVVFCLLILVLSPLIIRADPIGDLVASLLNALLGLLISVVGWIVTKLFEILLYIAQWNSFINIKAVETGWILARDLCNMFFIVILLVIAIGTILKIESYSYKKWLAKLVIVAIVINFSKYITGALITLSQVAMLTFVGSFKEAAVGNIIKGLHLDAFMSAAKEGAVGGENIKGQEKITIWNVTAVYALALLFLIILAMVLLIMIIILLGRMISFWVLTILSPFAYFFQASPVGAEYAKKWWQLFGKNLIAGPVLAFFLWLSFFTIQSSGTSFVASMEKENIGMGKTSLSTSGTTEVESQLAGISNTNYMIDFIVVIGLLIAAIKITQEMGVIGSKFAGQMQQNLGKWGKSVLKGAGKVAALPAVGAWAGVKGLAKYGARKLNESIKEGKAPPILNPAALIRGWNARRENLYSRAKDGASASARELFEKAFGEPPIPHKENLDFAEASKMAQELKFMTKDGLGDLRAKLLRKKKLSSYDMAVARGLEINAGSRGYIDDACSNEEIFKKFSNLIINDTIAGEKIKDLNNYVIVHKMLIATHGSDATGLATIINLDEDGKKTGHAQDIGHGIYDSRIKMKRYTNIEDHEVTLDKLFKPGDVNPKDLINPETGEMYTAPAYEGPNIAVTEMSKLTKRAQVGQQMQGLNAYGSVSDSDDPKRIGRIVSSQRGYAEEAIYKSTFEGANKKLTTEHTNDRNDSLDIGGSPEKVYFEEDGSLKINTIELRNVAFNDLANSIKIPDNWKKRGGIPEEYLNDQGEIKDMENILKNVIRYKIGSSGIEVSLADLRKEGVREALTEDIQINKEGNFSGNIKTREDLIRALGISGGGGTSPLEGSEPESEEGLRPSAPRVAEHFDEEKHSRTNPMVKRYKDADEDFYESEEYLDNQDKYENGLDYQRHENALNQKELNEVRGVQTASKKEEGAEQAGVGLNFNDSNIQKVLGVTTNQDAVYFDGENKQKAIDAIIEIYKKQLQDSGDGNAEEKVVGLKKGLENSETLRIHNNASMSGRMVQARHEMAHARTQNLSDEGLNDIWDSMGKEQQTVITEDLKSRYPNLTDKQMKQEAVAEMVGVDKGIYRAQGETRKVLANKHIKTRPEEKEDEIVEKVSEASAMIRAGGSKAKTGLKNFAKLLGKMGGGLGGEVEKIANLPIVDELGSKIGKVKKVINSAIKGLKDKKIDGAISRLLESDDKKITLKENYDSVVKQTNGDEIEEAKNEKRENTDNAKKHFEKAKKAEENGDITEARNQTKKGNKFLDNNNVIDRDTINPLKDAIKKAKKDYAKAVSQVVKDYENFNKLVGNASPEAKIALEKVVKVVSSKEETFGRETEDKEARKTKIKKATQNEKPEEIVNAAQEEVEEKTAEINSGKLDTAAIVSELTNIGSILIAVQAALGEMSSAKVDPKESLKLNNFIKDIKEAKSGEKGTGDRDFGSVFDSSSTKSLLVRINTHLKKLTKNPKKSFSEVSKETPSTTKSKNKK